MNSSSTSNRWLWLSGIAFFIVAGLTGFMFRLGMLGGDIFGFSLQNIRHAHSHLMFFGWAGLLPFLIHLKERTAAHSDFSDRVQRSAITSIAILSPITYIFFLVWGYHPVAIGDAQLPLAAIFSSFVMIAWYVFAIGFWRSKSEADSLSQPWLSAALMMLLVSSLGAWGVGVLQFFDVANILIPKAMTHFFLGTFTEGWVVLVVMGLIAHALKLQTNDFHFSTGTLRSMIALGAPLTFAYGIQYSMLTDSLLWSARVGGLVTSIALLVFVTGAISKCWRYNSIWFWPIILLGIKAIIQILISLFPNELWLSDHNLRILYLHILLLGAFTIACFAFIHAYFKTSRRSFNSLVFSCLAVIGTLLLPTSLIPAVLKGAWVFDTITFVALLPVIAAAYQFVLIKFNRVN